MFTAKVLPHRIPELIFTDPQDYGTLNFKVTPLMFLCPSGTYYLLDYWCGNVGNGISNGN